MATAIKFLCGEEKNLSSIPVRNGQVMFTTDTKRIFFDYNNERLLMCGDETKENDNYGKDPIFKIEEQIDSGSEASPDSRYGCDLGDIDLPPADYESWIHWLRS